MSENDVKALVAVILGAFMVLGLIANNIPPFVEKRPYWQKAFNVIYTIGLISLVSILIK